MQTCIKVLVAERAGDYKLWVWGLADCVSPLDITILDRLYPDNQLPDVDSRCQILYGTVDDFFNSPDIFPTTCPQGLLPGCDTAVTLNSLALLFYPQNPRSLGRMRIGEYLTYLGLGSITAINNPVTIVYVGGPSTVQPTPFLQNLLYVNGSLTIEDRTQSGSVNRQISSYPSLQSLQYVATLTLNQVGFANLSSLSGLKCVAGSTAIRDSSRLATLAGLEKVEVLNFADPLSPSLVVENCPLLGNASFGAIASAAGCGTAGGGTPPYPSVLVNVSSCAAPLTSFQLLCAFIQGACPSAV